MARSTCRRRTRRLRTFGTSFRPRRRRAGWRADRLRGAWFPQRANQSCSRTLLPCLRLRRRFLHRRLEEICRRRPHPSALRESLLDRLPASRLLGLSRTSGCIRFSSFRLIGLCAPLSHRRGLRRRSGRSVFCGTPSCPTASSPLSSAEWLERRRGTRFSPRLLSRQRLRRPLPLLRGIHCLNRLTVLGWDGRMDFTILLSRPLGRRLLFLIGCSHSRLWTRRLRNTQIRCRYIRRPFRRGSAMGLGGICGTGQLLLQLRPRCQPRAALSRACKARQRIRLTRGP